MLIMLALLLPVVMAIWFAAPLVVFHEHGAVEAMKGSFAGCLKNIVPFLVYGVVLFVFAIVATLPLLLGWLVLGPVFAASVYTSYRDIYFKPQRVERSSERAGPLHSQARPASCTAQAMPSAQG